MPCDGRYGEAWEYAAFFCIGAILSGVDDSGGGPNADLQDSQVDFRVAGIEANAGMTLYNTTQNTSGPVTAVTSHTLTATGVTWNDGEAYRIVALGVQERSTIEHYLNVSASDIYAALAATGACDCTLASWAGEYLAKLNVIEAAAYYNCDCGNPRFSGDQRRMLFEWADAQLEALRTGKLEVCQGATGADFPDLRWAEIAWTDFAAARIITNRLLRQG